MPWISCLQGFVMTAEIVNLRRARKAKGRREAEAHAEVNRAKFGRSKHERDVERAAQGLADRRLDALRRDQGPAGQAAEPSDEHES